MVVKQSLLQLSSFHPHPPSLHASRNYSFSPDSIILPVILLFSPSNQNEQTKLHSNILFPHHQCLYELVPRSVHFLHNKASSNFSHYFPNQLLLIGSFRLMYPTSYTSLNKIPSLSLLNQAQHDPKHLKTTQNYRENEFLAGDVLYPFPSKMHPSSYFRKYTINK